MPYCNLNSSEIIGQTKKMIAGSDVLKEKTDLAGFYDQVAQWDSDSIKSIFDKKVTVAQFSYDVRVYSHRNNEEKPCTVERDLHFTISICDDKLYAVVNGGKFYYCGEISGDKVSGAVAQKVGEKAAADIYTPMFEKNGYVYDRCEISNWSYDGKAFDYYTEYTIGYTHTNGEEDSISIVGSGNVLAMCTCPYDCEIKEAVEETECVECAECAEAVAEGEVAGATKDGEAAEAEEEDSAVRPARRSFALFMSILFALGAVAAVFMYFQYEVLSVLDFLKDGDSFRVFRVAAAGCIAGSILFNLIALLSSKKGFAVLGFLASAGALGCAIKTFWDVEIASILKATNILSLTSEWLVILILVALLLSVICAFIGMIRTHGKKVIEEDEEDDDEDEDEEAEEVEEVVEENDED